MPDALRQGRSSFTGALSLSRRNKPVTVLLANKLPRRLCKVVKTILTARDTLAQSVSLSHAQWRPYCHGIILSWACGAILLSPDALSCILGLDTAAIAAAAALTRVSFHGSGAASGKAADA